MMSTPDERALIGMLPYTALTVVVTLIAVGKNVTLRLLGSLTYYLIPETPQEQAKARLARVTAGKSPSEVRRRAARIKANISEDAEGTESIAAVKFGKALVLAPYFREFDYALLFAILVVAAMILSLVRRARNELAEPEPLPQRAHPEGPGTGGDG